MYEYRYGGKRGKSHRLVLSDDMVVVRGRAGSLPRLSATKDSRSLLRSMPRVSAYPDAGVAVFTLRPARSARERERVLARLKRDRGLRFAGHCLMDRKSRRPVVYTENLFLRFGDDVSPAAVERLLRRYKLKRKRWLRYAGNAVFAEAREGIGRAVFDLAATLLEKHEEIELCHPELIRERQTRVAYPQQWHLRATTIGGNLIEAHASVEAAWRIGRGQGSTIAVIDDGVDVDHVEFRAAGGIVAPRDMTIASDDPRPKRNEDNHGTACAGVACAAGVDGASGVAPEARLMPLRLASGLGSQDEADAFVWAARNGADVISCSWGPFDGEWWNPADPVHQQVVPLPDSTRLAIDFALEQGRGGRGCVIAWAAGNGNESVEHDGYASHPGVIAVGACNDRGTRSVYSDYGRPVWCCFPSSDLEGDELTPGIWTTDRLGSAGYNPGSDALGHAAGNYTNDFGGTSSAAPGVAGLCALVLSVKPALSAADVKQVLAETADRIDEEHGKYDKSGRSPLYGHGRVNALRALDSL